MIQTMSPKPFLFFSMLALTTSGNIGTHHLVNAMKLISLRQKMISSPIPSSHQRIKIASQLTNTALHANNNGWWDGDTNSIFSKSSSANGKKENQYEQYYRTTNASNVENQKNQPPSLITREMEEEVMASARATMDSNTVSGAFSSLIDDNSNNRVNCGNGSSNNYRANENSTSRNSNERKSKNRLRDLALTSVPNSSGTSNDETQLINSSNNISSNSWDTQQIALASGATTFLLSPLVIPILHSFVPPILPFPSSISFTGAALLGTLSYIVALGDPTTTTTTTATSNILSEKAVGVLGDGPVVEVGGAVSRIVGRTALQSAQASAPRLKAAARALVDYDSATATLEELRTVQRELSQTVLELGSENEVLRKEVALWQAVEDVSSMYKLEELKEMARYGGLKGYSSEGKNALLRRLVREGMIKLDLSPYY